MIVEVSGGFKIRSHKTGKLYPKVYTSREATQRRIDQMEQFKHINKSVAYVILQKGRSVKEWMEYLKIDPEKASPSHKFNSIGKSKKDGKWYGWSHRAIHGFKTRSQAIKFARSVS